MAEFEEKLNSILSNPQMMQTIMSMAGSFSQQSQPAPPPQQPPAGLSLDPASMQKMMELLRGTQLDQRQQGLVNALGAYLPQDKLSRLQRAMQASKLAKFASVALSKQNGR